MLLQVPSTSQESITLDKGHSTYDLFNNQQLSETNLITKCELSLPNIRDQATIKGGAQQYSPGGIQPQYIEHAESIRSEEKLILEHSPKLQVYERNIIMET